MQNEPIGTLPPGFQLAGRYRVIKHLAAGGFGITYLAEHEALKKQYAIKEHFPREFAFREGSSVRPNTADRDIFGWAMKRFAEEAEKLARFRHPAIVVVADVFEANGTAYMVMEFEPGETMSKWLDGLGRPPSQAELDRIAGSLLDALDVMHGANFLHRDIAPDNIIIRPDGSPCLIDFGAARQAMGHQTKTLTAIVKAGYSPVEQYDTEGSDGQGACSDIYALAATLYRAVTGTKPPEAPGRAVKDRYVPVARVAPAGLYRTGFLAAIDDGLRVSPDSRPSSVVDWRSMLMRPDKPETVVVSAVANARPRMRSLPVKIAAIGLGAAVLGGGAWWSMQGAVTHLPALKQTEPSATVKPQPSTQDRADDEAFSKAESEGVISAWQDYLERFPAGRHLAEAKQRINDRLLAGRLVTTFPTQNDKILKIFQPTDQSRVYSISYNGHITEVGHFLDPRLLRGPPYTIAVSPDGKHVVTSASRELKLWDISHTQTIAETNAPTEVRTFKNPSEFYSAVFTPDGRTLIAAPADDTLRVWDVASGRSLQTVRGTSRTQVAVNTAISSDGRYLVSGSVDKVMKVWEVSTWREVRSLVGHAESIDAVAITPNGTHVASVCRDGYVRVFEVSSGREVWRFDHPKAVSLFLGIAFSQDGKYLAVASPDVRTYAVNLWNVENGTLAARLEGHRQSVRSILFTRDRRFVLTGSEDTTVKEWDITGL